MTRRHGLIALALVALLAGPVGAQYGWFSLDGGLIARLSSTTTAATIRQDGSGAVLDLYAGATRVWRVTSTGITSAIAGLFPDGTAALPSVAQSSDPDNGLWFGANVVNVSTAGVQRLQVTATGQILALTPTGGVGYGTGAGGAVTQATDKATGVTLDKVTGNITMNAASLAADTTVSFTLTNAAIAAEDVVVVSHHSAGTAGAYTLTAQAAAGSAVISVRNITGAALGEAIVIKFAVIKAATS